MDLFTSLRRFRPTDKRDPLEDFLTEVWRWVLENDAEVAGRFLARLGLPEDAAPRTRWDTQVRLANGACIVDLVGDVPGGPVVVCEHKVWSPLADQQVAKYRAAATERWPGRPVLSVLVTGRAWQHVQRADHAMTWADVHQMVSHHGTSAILRELATFLEANHLGPTRAVLAEALLAHAVKFDLNQTLERLFTDVARSIHHRPVAPRMAKVLGTRVDEWPPVLEVSSPEKRWGRLGVELPSAPAWRPGCFIGVLMDPRDHHVDWSEPSRGPDLTLILSFHLEPGVPDRHAFLDSVEYRSLLDRLASQGPGCGVNVHDHLSEVRSPNRWHPLHLRRPLVDVLGQAVDGADQTDATLAAIDGMLELLLRAGELESLAERLRAT